MRTVSSFILNHIAEMIFFVLILLFEIVFSLNDELNEREKGEIVRRHPAVLVRLEEMSFIEGVYRVSGMHNDAFAYESREHFAIARDEESWVLGTMIPEPRLLCTSKQHSLVLPTTEWECVGRMPSVIFLKGSEVAHRLYSEARLEQTERRRPKQALMLYHAAYETVLYDTSLQQEQQPPPYIADILLGIGTLSRYFGYEEDALKYLKMSAKYKSTLFASLTILGSLLHESEEFEDALNARLEASKLDSQNFDVFRSLGETYTRLGRYREALENFHKARDLLEETNIPYTARMPSMSRDRAPLIWALVLTGIGNSLRNLGKDADLIWRFGSKVGIWPSMHRRYVIPYRHERATHDLDGLPVLTKGDLETCVDEKDPLYELHQAVQLLETEYNEIREEILSVMKQRPTLLEKESENLHKGIDWSHIRFTDRGQWNDQVETWFPKTSRVLRQIYPFDACASHDSKRCPSQLFVRTDYTPQSL